MKSVIEKAMEAVYGIEVLTRRVASVLHRIYCDPRISYYELEEAMEEYRSYIDALKDELESSTEDSVIDSLREKIHILVEDEVYGEFENVWDELELNGFFKNGASLIREDCFVEHIREEVYEAGHISADMPWWLQDAIDWDKVAKGISSDYYEIKIGPWAYLYSAV
jgi:hypothetical protein